MGLGVFYKPQAHAFFFLSAKILLTFGAQIRYFFNPKKGRPACAAFPKYSFS